MQILYLQAFPLKPQQILSQLYRSLPSFLTFPDYPFPKTSHNFGRPQLPKMSLPFFCGLLLFSISPYHRETKGCYIVDSLNNHIYGLSFLKRKEKINNQLSGK